MIILFILLLLATACSIFFRKLKLFLKRNIGPIISYFLVELRTFFLKRTTIIYVLLPCYILFATILLIFFLKFYIFLLINRYGIFNILKNLFFNNNSFNY